MLEDKIGIFIGKQKMRQRTMNNAEKKGEKEEEEKKQREISASHNREKKNETQSAYTRHILSSVPIISYTYNDDC